MEQGKSTRANPGFEKGWLRQNSPTPDNPTPLPSELQINQKVFIDFGGDQKVNGEIRGVLFYDPALYYEVIIPVVNAPDDKLYTLIDVPAGLVKDGRAPGPQTERYVISKMHEICTESLPGVIMEKWVEVASFLYSNRPALCK